MKFSQHLATNILLAGVLVLLVLIWHRMPPTAGEIAAAKGSDRKALTMRQPVVRATITDTLDVNVENTSLDVEVGNALPIPVTIEK